MRSCQVSAPVATMTGEPVDAPLQSSSALHSDDSGHWPGSTKRSLQ